MLVAAVAEHERLLAAGGAQQQATHDPTEIKPVEAMRQLSPKARKDHVSNV